MGFVLVVFLSILWLFVYLIGRWNTQYKNFIARSITAWYTWFENRTEKARVVTNFEPDMLGTRGVKGEKVWLVLCLVWRVFMVFAFFGCFSGVFYYGWTFGRRIFFRGCIGLKKGKNWVFWFGRVVVFARPLVMEAWLFVYFCLVVVWWLVSVVYDFRNGITIFALKIFICYENRILVVGGEKISIRQNWHLNLTYD